MVEDPSTPVLVLVSHHHVGIGIARSLGRLGIRVYGMDRDRFSPMFFSRYCRGLFIWDLHRAPVGDSIAFLREVSRKIGRRALLIPTSDIGAMFVEEHADQLADKYIFPERSACLVRSLCNKREMYYLARRCNVDAPETAFPRSREDVVEYLKTALTEMRDRTFVGESGRRYPGTEVVGGLWERGLADSLGPRREQNLTLTLREVEHALDGNPRADDLLEEFHAHGTIRPTDDGAFVAAGTY